MVRAASKQLKRLPSNISFPRKTSRGSLASCLPSGVRSSPIVSAFTSIRESMARLTFFERGGSRASARVCSMLPSLQILTRRTRSWRESRSISGVCCSAIWIHISDLGTKRLMGLPPRTRLSWRDFVKRWKQRPFCTRPARPRRCLAFAREMKDSRSLDSCRLSSNLTDDGLVDVRQVEKGITVPHLLVLSCINDTRDIGYGDASFCDISGEHNFPGPLRRD